MRLLARGLLCLLFVLGNLSCSVNVLENFADKNTNEAYFVDAQILINKGDFNGALAKIALMNGTYPTLRKVINLKADAYGGLCGLNFVDFALSFKDMTGNLLPFLMTTFNAGTLVDSDSCTEAQNLLASLGDASERTTDENVMMMVFGFTKVGTILGAAADTNDDGVADPAFDSCDPADLSDAYAREVGTGITQAIASLNAISSSVNLGSSSLASLNALCAMLPGGYNFCSVTDPTAFTANEVKGLRTLIKEDSAIGLGADCDGDVTACNCP